MIDIISGSIKLKCQLGLNQDEINTHLVVHNEGGLNRNVVD
jgi:hypothetical protein